VTALAAVLLAMALPEEGKLVAAFKGADTLLVLRHLGEERYTIEDVWNRQTFEVTRDGQTFTRELKKTAVRYELLDKGRTLTQAMTFEGTTYKTSYARVPDDKIDEEREAIEARRAEVGKKFEGELQPGGAGK